MVHQVLRREGSEGREACEAKGVRALVYEPMPDASDVFGIEAECDLIMANLWSSNLDDVADKVYARSPSGGLGSLLATINIIFKRTICSLDIFQRMRRL